MQVRPIDDFQVSTNVVDPEGELTLIGPFDGNDQRLEVIGLGTSEFHMSCSDPDMNGTCRVGM